MKPCKNKTCDVKIERGLRAYCSYECEREAAKARKFHRPPELHKERLISPVTGRGYPTRHSMIEALVWDAKCKIKKRDHHTCQKCGKRVSGWNCQGSHVEPMSKVGNCSLAWDVNNIKVLCDVCHLFWWELNKREAREWFDNKFPERAEYLRTHKGDKLSTFQIGLLYDELKKRSTSKWLD